MHGACKALVSSGTKEEREVTKVRYKIAKREAKKVIAVAKSNGYERLY